MKILPLLFILSASLGFAQTRTVTVDGNGTLVSPPSDAFAVANDFPTLSGNNSFSGTNTFVGLLRAAAGPHFNPVLLETTTPLLWNGIEATLSVEASGRHAIIAKSLSGGGAAIVGWSLSGAPAGKFYQSASYTSPALVAVRETTGGFSPTVLVHAVGGADFTASAISVTQGTNENFKVSHGGTVTATGNIHAEGTIITSSSISASAISAENTITSRYQKVGSGDPNGAVAAPVGAVYHRTDGGAGTSFYVKESGTGTTGWVAK